MKSHFTRSLTSLQKAPKSCNGFTIRYLTTTTDPKKASGLSLGVKEQIYYDHQESTFPSLELPNSDLFSHTLQKSNKWQNLVSLECGVTGRQYTYAQMIDGALRWSSVIQKTLPNQHNPTIAFLTPNTPEYVVLFFGSVAQGATVSPINPIYTPQEIAHHLQDSNASMLVVDAMVEPLADCALKILGKDIPVFVNGPSINGRPNVMEIISDSSAPMADPKDIDPSTTAFLPYSSGTTGKPKGVKLSHNAITSNMALYMNDIISGLKEASADGKQDVQLGILPFFHIYGMSATLLTSVFFGGKLVTLPMFDPTLFTSTLKKYKMTSLQVVPPLLQFMAANPHITKEDLSSLHSFIIGAAPVPANAAVAIKEKAPNALIQEGYGMTETLLTHITAQNGEKIGYCGHLLPNCKAKIIDLETGESLAPNEKGELCVQTPSMMTGYHNNEKATKETIDEEGWLHTGDVAIYTEDGYYSVVDRIKELIKVKGLQVSPSEVEENLMEHPSIADAGVVGISHPKYGEVPQAFIVRSDNSLTDNEVHSFMSEKLAKHKQIVGGIHFVDELPKSSTGKLLRRMLKQMSTAAEVQ